MKRLLALFLISGTCVGQDYLNQYTSHAEMLKQLKQLGVKTQQIGTSRSGKSIIAAQFGELKFLLSYSSFNLCCSLEATLLLLYLS